MHQEIQISRDIPPPDGSSKASPIYPWAELGVGDSFVHPGGRNSASSAMWQASKRHGHKYKSQREGTGYRIWRIA